MLFHHALGQTPGFLAFADELREAGHTVHTPDVFAGKTFGDLEEGVAHAQSEGFGTIVERGAAAAEGLPAELVYAGLSLGVLPAQMLAQTRPGARGALLLYATVSPEEFGGAWPGGVPLQIHAMEGDPWMAEDLEVARKLVAEAEDAELFLYPGSGHVFAESGLDDYDEQAAALLLQRLLAFLGRVG